MLNSSQYVPNKSSVIIIMKRNECSKITSNVDYNKIFQCLIKSRCFAHNYEGLLQKNCGDRFNMLELIKQGKTKDKTIHMIKIFRGPWYHTPSVEILKSATFLIWIVVLIANLQMRDGKETKRSIRSES